MRSLLVNFAQFRKELDELIKSKQADNSVGLDWEGDLSIGTDKDGKPILKKIKMWLPQDVRQQYKALLYTESFSLANLANSFDNDAIFDNRMSIFEIACKNMLVDNRKDFDINVFTVDFIDMIITIYVTEMLLPLYHRSNTAAESVLKASLGKFMKQQQKE